MLLVRYTIIGHDQELPRPAHGEYLA
jgi:hypothetical protein